MPRALLMSIGMFSILPVPKNHWNDRSLPWVIPMMPVVGGLIGAAWYVVALSTAGIPDSLRAVTILLTPFVLSGFLHVDGYMDAADAVFSRRDLEEKKRILKDSHVGAFAVIAIVCLMLIQFCATETILVAAKPLAALLFVPIISRCVVGLLMLRMPPMSETGFAAMFQKNTGRLQQIFLLGLWLLAISSAFTLNVGLALLVETLTATGMMFYLDREFRGISGDLCGCSITVAELAALLSIALI